MNLGENIYRLRTGKGMSQDALANALEVSRQSVSKWENNSAVPELEKLMNMASIFGVTLDELVGRTETPHQSSPAPVPAPEVTQTSPGRRTLGAVLLSFGLVATLLLSILGGLIIGILAGLPFVLVGCVLLSDSRDPLFSALWVLFAVYAPVGYWFTLSFMGYGLYIRCGILAVWFAALIVWSIVRHRRGKLSRDSKRLVIGSLIGSLVLSILLSVGTAIYYYQTGLHSDNQELEATAEEFQPD